MTIAVLHRIVGLLYGAFRKTERHVQDKSPHQIRESAGAVVFYLGVFRQTGYIYDQHITAIFYEKMAQKGGFQYSYLLEGVRVGGKSPEKSPR